MFKGRKLLIATMHKKEMAIAHILEKELGVKCVLPENFNSDLLGTFSGEIERKDDPLLTAKKKCLAAIEQSNCDLVISSEGSFGPHPHIFFLPANEEFLYFMDLKNNLEISVKEISINTNFSSKEILSEKELFDFASKSKFPSHGLILRNAHNEFKDITKGIRDSKTLKNSFNFLLEKHGKAYIETDMRAMHNPTRMKVIKQTTRLLAKKIKHKCPNCHAPGFGITKTKRGLPCKICSYKTNSVLSYVYTCSNCFFEKEALFPHKKVTEDPMYCDICNP